MNLAFTSILEGHHFYLAMVGVCFLYTTAAGIVQRYIILELEGCNEKADMRFIFHANFIAEFLKG